MLESESAHSELPVEFTGMELEMNGPVAAIVMPSDEENILLVIAAAADNANLKDPKIACEDPGMVTED